MKISLKAARVSANLKQADLAALVGVCRETISDWENGVAMIPGAMLLKVAEGTGIPIERISLPERRAKRTTPDAG